jgi:pilus assembly protein Flp/PilA
MNKLWNVAINLLKDDSGQDLIEYALVAALIGLAAVTSMTALATGINSEFNKVTSALAAS